MGLDVTRDAVDFHWDKRRTRRGALLLAVLGLAGLALVGLDGIDAKALGIGWFVSFAALSSAVLSRGTKSAPVLTISPEGVHDRRISTAPITWEKIARIEGFEAETVTFVGLDFLDARSTLADAKPLVRVFAPLHRLLGFPAVSLNTSLLDGGDRDVIAAIERFRPSLVAPRSH